jgi:hypothetical protein
MWVVGDERVLEEVLVVLSLRPHAGEDEPETAERARLVDAGLALAHGIRHRGDVLVDDGGVAVAHDGVS